MISHETQTHFILLIRFYHFSRKEILLIQITTFHLWHEVNRMKNNILNNLHVIIELWIEKVTADPGRGVWPIWHKSRNKIWWKAIEWLPTYHKTHFFSDNLQSKQYFESQKWQKKAFADYLTFTLNTPTNVLIVYTLNDAECNSWSISLVVVSSTINCS